MIFKKFNLDCQAEYKKFYAKLPPYSDFSFNNLMVWLDIYDDLHYSIVNTNYIFRFSNPFQDDEVSYTLIGTEKIEETLSELRDEIINANHKLTLSMVPACFAEKINTDSSQVVLSVKKEPDNRDYLFDVPAAHSAKGKTFYHLRRGLNYFLKNYGDEIIARPLDLYHDADRSLVINSMHQWETVFSLTENDKLRIEGVAIDRYLRLAPNLEVKSMGIFINGKLQAFSIFHLPPQPHYAIGNHIKCNYQYRGIFNMTYYATVAAMFDLGVKIANEEQDLGIAGIRQHKEARNPIGYLDRYTIELQPA